VFGNNPRLTAGSEAMRMAAVRQPRARVAHSTTALDSAQPPLDTVTKQFYRPGVSCAEPSVDWYRARSETLQPYATDTPRFRYPLAASDHHVLSGSPPFFNEGLPGISFSTGSAHMLTSTGAWDHEACATCLIPLPRP
jgi:hypothetical protein